MLYRALRDDFRRSYSVVQGKVSVRHTEVGSLLQERSDLEENERELEASNALLTMQLDAECEGNDLTAQADWSSMLSLEEALRGMGTVPLVR